MYFIALSFRSHFLLYKRLEHFRRRFDPTYLKINGLLLGLGVPFSPDPNRKMNDLISGIEDLIDGYFCGDNILDEEGLIRFSQLDYFFGKRGTLCLRPELSADFDHLFEGLYQELKYQQVSFKKQRSFHKRPYLPLGRFLSRSELELAYSSITQEFPLPIDLMPYKIVLVEKGPVQWIIRHDLFTFNSSHHNEFYGYSEAL